MCARPANPELRNRILDAATDIVEGCGPDCVTMREVAEKIGYSPTTIYLYFTDKHEMLRETILRGFDDLADSTNAAMVGPTPLDKLRQRSRAYIAWGVNHPGLYQLMFESRIEIEFSATEGDRARRGLDDGAVVVNDAIAAGQIIPSEELMGLGDLIWAGLHGITSLSVSRNIGPDSATASRTELLEAAGKLGDELLSRLLAPHLGEPAQVR